MIRIIESTPFHIKELATTLREADKKEIEALDTIPEAALSYSFNSSVLRRTGLVNGKVAAMWGVYGVPLGITGQPYLLTNHLVETIPVKQFISVYKNEVQQMKKLFPVLVNYVDASYEGAVRMLKIAGFTLEPITLNDTPFYKFSMVS